MSAGDELALSLETDNSLTLGLSSATPPAASVVTRPTVSLATEQISQLTFPLSNRQQRDKSQVIKTLKFSKSFLLYCLNHYY